MKRHLLAIPLLLLSFFIFNFATTTQAHAATCDDLGGYCRIKLVKCAYGTPISGASDCSILQNCCPNPITCASLDGHCIITGNCAYGGALTAANNCILPGEKCCPNNVGNPNQSGGVKCTDINGSEGVNTALGCISVGSGNELVNTILRLALGVGGGLALVLILYGTFIVTTSAGIPDKLKAGGEIITSAIIGLIFILLSIFLVNLIGINILGIPGFLQ